MIYVDDWQQQARVGRLNARWSHLTVGPFDDPAELHAFAERIGLQRSWYQGPPEHPWPRCHYDVTEAKRQQAIREGASAITWREAGWQMVCAREAWRNAQNPICARTANGRPPSQADLRAVARALYEVTTARRERSVAVEDVRVSVAVEDVPASHRDRGGVDHGDDRGRRHSGGEAEGQDRRDDSLHGLSPKGR